MAEDIVSRLVLRADQFTSTLRGAEQRTNQFQRNAQRGFTEMSRTVQNVGRVLASVFVTGVIGRGINNVARLGDELAKMSARTGFSVESLNGLTQAANLADVTNEQLSVGLRQLSKNLLDTTRGTGEAKDSFKAMGIGAKEAEQLLKTPDQAFLTIAERLAAIPDVSRRSAEAMRIFGRSGSELLPLLNQGSAAIQQQIEKYQKLRPITTEQAKAAEAYNDALAELGFAAEGLGIKLTADLIPALTETATTLTQVVSFNYSDAFATLFPQIDLLDFKLSSLREKLISTTESIGAFVFQNLTAENQKRFQTFIETLLGVKFKEGGGKKPAATTPPDIDTLPTVNVAELSKSAEIAGLIDVNEARVKFIQAEEANLETKSDRVFIIEEELALLREALAIQKEIEDAHKKDKEREVDGNVAITARIEKEARLKEIQNERLALLRQTAGEEQEQLGADIQHELTLREQQKHQQVLTQFALEQKAIHEAINEAGDDAAQIRGGEILLFESKINLLKKENELFGETVERNTQVRDLLKEINRLRKEGSDINQESLGRGIVSAGRADISGRIEPFRRAVREAEAEVQRGASLPGQLPETNRQRRIELIEKTIVLLQKERSLGLISFEDFSASIGAADAELRSETYKTQRGFFEGWRDAFRQFSSDAEGAFGLGQTLARQFTTNIQNFTSSVVQNVFTKLEEGTLTWRSALETIPSLLQQITSQLIGMAVAQGVARAIGGGFGGAFGGGISAGAQNAAARGAANPALFGPGFYSGGSFMVGGPAGVDRTPVSFMASRGERVDVLTPAQQGGGGGGGWKINIFNNSSSQVSARENADGRTIEVFVEQTARRSFQRGALGKDIHRAMGIPRRGTTA